MPSTENPPPPPKKMHEPGCFEMICELLKIIIPMCVILYLTGGKSCDADYFQKQEKRELQEKLDRMRGYGR